MEASSRGLWGGNRSAGNPTPQARTLRGGWAHAVVLALSLSVFLVKLGPSLSLLQVEETVAAFKIDKLPEALLKEIDVIHEEFRSPCNFFADKPTCVEAPWLTQ